MVTNGVTKQQRYVRVKIEAVLYVDLEQWATEYGTERTASAVRADVKKYYGIANLMPEHHVADDMVIGEETARVLGLAR